MGIKSVISKIDILYRPAHYIYKIIVDYCLHNKYKSEICKERTRKRRIYYLGIPAHSNLGDLAQGVCIRRWIKKHYADYDVVEVETNALVNNRWPVLKDLKANYNHNDLIIFQSGYTTTDLGGFADEMHRAVMKAIPKAKMLMMPQTIFFKKEDNKIRTASVYGGMDHLLFLARDQISYAMAKEMFPRIPVYAYPDIVTTLIGTQYFDEPRKGIMFCLRDDGEKLYSDKNLEQLILKCKTLDDVQRTDTTKKGSTKEIVKHAVKHIMDEIIEYAKYKVVVTDRYHGTILALAAGTPVVILKTTDHKVTTGADWFKGIYDDYVYVADDLDDAYKLITHVLSNKLSYKLSPYFEKEFYDKLPSLFEKETRER